jgi:hypothetical protein
MTRRGANPPWSHETTITGSCQFSVRRSTRSRIVRCVKPAVKVRENRRGVEEGVVEIGSERHDIRIFTYTHGSVSTGPFIPFLVGFRHCLRLCVNGQVLESSGRLDFPCGLEGRKVGELTQHG